MFTGIGGGRTGIAAAGSGRVLSRGRRPVPLVVAVVLVLALFILGAGAAYAAGAPAAAWETTFGGSGDERGFSVQQTGDGGYIAVGETSTYGNGSGDVYLVKTGASGAASWERTFGGSGSDLGSAVQQTGDGGYIVAGTTFSYGSGGSDIYLVKTDSAGNRVWEKAIGGSGAERGCSVQQTGDGGYIIAGSTSSYGSGSDDAYLVKTDSSGNKEWNRTFGGSGAERAYSVRQTSDGGYILTGSTTSFGSGGSDAYLVKTDSNGNRLWEKTFGGSGDDLARSVRQASDGGYILAGTADLSGEGGAVYLVRTDAAGSRQWEKKFNREYASTGESVWQDGDGGYVVAGDYAAYNQTRRAYLIKTSSSGDKQWEFVSGENRHARSARQVSGGGYIIAGFAGQPGGSGPVDLLLIKLGPQDAARPSVTSTDPRDRAGSVPLDKAITVTFSEDVSAGSDFEGIVLREALNSNLAVNKSISGRTLTITPANPLARDSWYTVEIPAGGVKDQDGNCLAGAYRFSFYTGTGWQGQDPDNNGHPPCMVKIHSNGKWFFLQIKAPEGYRGDLSELERLWQNCLPDSSLSDLLEEILDRDGEDGISPRLMVRINPATLKKMVEDRERGRGWMKKNGKMKIKGGRGNWSLDD